MKILQSAKNGQVVIALKVSDELTNDEKNKLGNVSKGTSIVNFQNFQVRYNKKGDLLGVEGHEYTDRFKTKLDKNRNRVSALDLSILQYGNAKAKKSRQTFGS